MFNWVPSFFNGFMKLMVHHDGLPVVFRSVSLHAYGTNNPHQSETTVVLILSTSVLSVTSDHSKEFPVVSVVVPLYRWSISLHRSVKQWSKFICTPSSSTVLYNPAILVKTVRRFRVERNTDWLWSVCFFWPVTCEVFIVGFIPTHSLSRRTIVLFSNPRFPSKRTTSTFERFRSSFIDIHYSCSTRIFVHIMRTIPSILP